MLVGQVDDDERNKDHTQQRELIRRAEQL